MRKPFWPPGCSSISRKVRDDLTVGPFEPEVAGLGQQVAPVQFRVWRGLLDDEYLDAQLEQLVERRGVQVLGPAAA